MLLREDRRRERVSDTVAMRWATLEGVKPEEFQEFLDTMP
ncbi:hypothetical protein AU375_02324 [Methylobacterium radiotolerans]|nr:hypothetical protein AU375_02324 [Methylobacterium radiotolerans]